MLLCVARTRAELGEGTGGVGLASIAVCACGQINRSSRDRMRPPAACLAGSRGGAEPGTLYS